MLDRGFAPDVESIIGRTPNERQTILLSATMPEWVARTAAKHLRRPVRVEVDAGLQAPPSVEHLVYSIQKNDKMEALLNAAGRERWFAGYCLSQDQAQRQTDGKTARFVGLPGRSAPRKSKPKRA